MSRRHAEIKQLVARAARKHDPLAVGTFADGEATFHGPEKNEPQLGAAASAVSRRATASASWGKSRPIQTWLGIAGARKRSSRSQPT